MEEDTLNIEVPEDSRGGRRLDVFLVSELGNMSRAAVQKLIEGGSVLLDGKLPRCSDAVLPGAGISVRMPVAGGCELAAEDIPLDVLCETPDFLVVNKQAGLVVHPGSGNATGTLVNAMLYRLDSEEYRELAEDDERPGIVHRLDKETSGALIVAKSAEAQAYFKDAFKNHEVRKIYLALLLGELKDSAGKIELPLDRHPYRRTKWRVVKEGGKYACTEYRRIAVARRPDGSAVTLVKILLHTGRTHQIRVHFSHLGHPVLGDALYGGCPSRMPCQAGRQMLHAWKLAFRYPAVGDKIQVTAPLPQDFLAALQALALPLPPEQRTE